MAILGGKNVFSNIESEIIHAPTRSARLKTTIGREPNGQLFHKILGMTQNFYFINIVITGGGEGGQDVTIMSPSGD